MSSELRIDAVHTGGMKMIASNGVHEVVADYPLEQGQATAGMKPLELLLASPFLVHGAGVDAEAVSKAIVQADEKLCPVWAMLEPNTAITTSYVVEG
jgi:uncharacterized OsmC-like protein